VRVLARRMRAARVPMPPRAVALASDVASALASALALALALASQPAPALAPARALAPAQAPAQLPAFALARWSPSRATTCLRAQSPRRRRARKEDPEAFEPAVLEPAVLYPAALDPRPVYPSPGNLPEFAAGSARENASTPPCDVPCSCDDVFDLERRVAKLQDQHRELVRRTLRLEHIIADLLESMQESDDVALLERNTCSAVVYNEQLTSSRPLRLLRHELRRLRGKWSI